MTQPQATRSIIDTHRHIFGPKLRQEFVENIGLDDSKVDVDYSMEIQRQSGVSSYVNSWRRGGDVRRAHHRIGLIGLISLPRDIVMEFDKRRITSHARVVALKG